MPIVSKTILKGYFNDGDVPNESNYIDLVDSLAAEVHLHDSDYHRKDAAIINSNYIDSGSYIDAATEFRVNGTPVGGLVMYSTSTFKSHVDWDGDLKSVAAYTLTPAMFGYPSNAKALYVKLIGKSSSGVGYVGINNLSTSYDYPLTINTKSTEDTILYGIVHLNASGNMILRVGTVTAYVTVEVWGYFI